MFRHFLVPLDDSDLSTHNVTEALKLARSLGAAVKLTFFHACADFDASAEGADVRAGALDALGRFPLFAEGGTPPSRPLNTGEVRERMLGDSRAILAKACSAAVAAGVKHDTRSVVSDRPAQAIVQAARDCGCDLIVMASHGPGGLRAVLSPSLTVKVMRTAGLPLFVTRVESADPQLQASHACALIQGEHRSLAAVVHAMKRSLQGLGGAAAAADAAGFGELLRYVHDYPEKLHHPKEEQSLHRLLRARSGRAEALLSSLEAQHQQEYRHVAALQHAWDDFLRRTGDEPALACLQAAFGVFERHVWEHLRLEEHELMPLAIDVLTEDDWLEIGEAFEGRQDPGYGEWSDEDFRRHFTRLANAMKLPEAAASVATPGGLD